jgi:putative ABC transport system substrate-binding protein
MGVFVGATLVRLLPARAQRGSMPVIGFLGSASAGPWVKRLRAFHEGLGKTGFAEGRNVAIEYRWADTHVDRLPVLAGELAQRQVDVIAVIGGVASALAAKAATATIPIVFRISNDPVESGLVASLNRPGGNITGVSTLGVEVAPKQVELLRDLLPAAKTFAALLNPTNPGNSGDVLRQLQAGTQTLGLKLHVVEASDDGALDMAFAALARLRPDALVISADLFLNTRVEQIAALAVRQGLPTISSYREFTEAGGLMSYGGGIVEGCRAAATYVGRILKGEKPGDLPVLLVTKLELTVNLKTAEALGLTVPPALLARADEVIE